MIAMPESGAEVPAPFVSFSTVKEDLTVRKEVICIICIIEFFETSSLLRVEHMCKKCIYDIKSIRLYS